MTCGLSNELKVVILSTYPSYKKLFSNRFVDKDPVIEIVPSCNKSYDFKYKRIYKDSEIAKLIEDAETNDILVLRYDS